MKEWQQKRVHVLGLLFFFVFDFIFYYPRIVLHLQFSVVLFTSMCLFFAVHIWFLNIAAVRLAQRIFPSPLHPVRQRLLLYVFLLPLSVVASSMLQALFFHLLNNRVERPLFYLHYEDVGMNLLYALIIIFFLELLYYFRHWSKAIEEAAELKKANVITQLDSLRNQVNPHFLFNSLNSLSSLIQVNPEQALTFVHKLANVYRYLLQTNQHSVTTLEEELHFLHAYLHLLKTRFGKALHFQLNIDAAAETYLLPPLTLQLLVENAVKHNIVAASQPLHITIYTANDTLTVKNNLQKKRTAAVSHGLGLKNIISKYKLLTPDPITIQETADTFTVVLPLLKNSSL